MRPSFPRCPRLLVFGLAFAALLGLEGCTEADSPSFDPTPTESPPPVVKQTGAIGGAVKDALGGAINAASIQLTSNGASVASASTDAQGQFLISGVPVGAMQVRASRTGFYSSAQAVQIANGSTSQVSFRLQPESMPSAGVAGVRVVSWNGATLNFQADIFVVDSAAKPIQNLPPSAFQITDFTGSSGALISFRQLGVTPLATPGAGPFSATMLLDQSGSIRDTDPNNARIQASKIFFNSFGPGDNGILAAFASSGRLPYELTLYGNGFTSDGPSYFTTLDALAALVDGGTPLYKSIVRMVDYTGQNGPNANKAVIVFTDGEDTSGGATIDDIVSHATNAKVKVFTVALGDANTAVLGEIAMRTGGAVMKAYDARQLISLYGTLGGLLHGTVSLYRGGWAISRSSGQWGSGSWVSTGVSIDTPYGRRLAPIFVRVP